MKAQPVIVHAVAAWLVGVLLFAAVHYHVVVPGLAPAATAYLVPVVGAVLASGFTFSLWHFVAPAWKLAQAELKLAGVTVPDFGPAPVSVPLGLGAGASPLRPALDVSAVATFPALPPVTDYVAQAAALSATA